jgi:hypothetical protein
LEVEDSQTKRTWPMVSKKRRRKPKSSVFNPFTIASAEDRKKKEISN